MILGIALAFYIVPLLHPFLHMHGLHYEIKSFRLVYDVTTSRDNLLHPNQQGSGP